MKMNLTKQEKYKAMGKFACFVHRWLVPAAGLLFVVVGLAKASERVWRGGVVGEAGSGVWVGVAGVNGSGWFSGDSGWAGMFVGKEPSVSREFVAVYRERIVVVSG